GEERFCRLGALGEVRCLGDNAHGSDLAVDGNKPDPCAGQGKHVNVNVIGGLSRPALDAFKPIVNGELIEQSVMVFQAELGAQHGIPSGSVNYELAAQEAFLAVFLCAHAYSGSLRI